MTSSSKLITPIKWAVGSWSVFIAENYVLSENRTFLIEEVFHNDDYYHYVYGLCSTTAVGSIIYAYRNKIQKYSAGGKASTLLWKLNSAIPVQNRILSFLTLSLGFGLISQTAPTLQIPFEYSDGKVTTKNIQGNKGLSQEEPQEQPRKKWKVRCPFDFTDSKSKSLNATNGKQKSFNDLHGIDRITRHPGLWSCGLLGLGSSFLSPCIPTRIWLSMPLMVALIGGGHTDSRFRRGMGGVLTKEMDDATSNVPFWAILSGKQGDGRMTILSLLREEVKGLNLVLGVGIAASIVASKGRGTNVHISRLSRA
mmetsp:Transcript_3115/g.4154  ORF Transcript_3115/g.4154 Transcript_3115/m.4154 type:complete len:310 (-) Transcript_3115:74-1003(-)